MNWQDHLKAFESMRTETREPQRSSQAHAHHSTTPSGRRKSSMRRSVAATAAQGRGGDTKLAEIGPRTAKMMDTLVHGGRKQLNPKTGLREYTKKHYGPKRYNEPQLQYMRRLLRNNKTSNKTQEPQDEGSEYGLEDYPYTQNEQNTGNCTNHSVKHVRDYAEKMDQYNKLRSNEFKSYTDRKKELNKNLIKKKKTSLEKEDPDLSATYRQFLSKYPLKPILFKDRLKKETGSYTGDMLEADAFPYTKHINDMNNQSSDKISKRSRDIIKESLKNKRLPAFDIPQGTYGPNPSGGGHAGEVTRIHRYGPSEEPRSREGSIDFSDSNIVGKVRGQFNKKGEVKTIESRDIPHFNLSKLNNIYDVDIPNTLGKQEKFVSKRYDGNKYKSLTGTDNEQKNQAFLNSLKSERNFSGGIKPYDKFMQNINKKLGK